MMTIPLRYGLVVVGFFLCTGCATTDKAHSASRGPQAPGESRGDLVSAMSHVVGAVSGKEMSEKDLRNLNQQIQKDPEAKSAIQTITTTLSGQGEPIKYCPIDGDRYSPKFTECPVHHVPLKSLTD